MEGRSQQLALRAIRERRPVVHCLTNSVTLVRVADALAALGARPIMASAEEEVSHIAARADALLLNLGTPDAERWRAVSLAAEAALEAGVPIVLDPVGCGASPWRTMAARDLVSEMTPSIVRGNAAEIATLAEIEAPGVVLRGVWSEGEAQQRELAVQASRILGTVVAVTGRETAVSDGERVQELASPPRALATVLGAGDVLSAVIAAVAGSAGLDPFESALVGQGLFEAAAREAGDVVPGPGSFWVKLVDALDRMATEAVEGAQRRGETQAI